MNSPSASTLLVLSALALTSPALATEPETGIDSTDVSSVTYRPATVVQKRQGERVKDALGSRLGGSTHARRVSFQYEGEESGAGFKVSGELFRWDNLRVELYRVADLAAAVVLANHEREEGGEDHLVEARGRRVLVMTGYSLSDTSLIAEVRDLAWPQTAPKRVDILIRKDSMHDMLFAASDEAIAASPRLGDDFAQQAALLDMLTGSDPSITVTTQGELKRVQFPDGGVMTFGPNFRGMYSDLATEQSFTELLDALVQSPPTPSTGLGGPLSSGISAALSSGLSAALPSGLSAASSSGLSQASSGSQ